MQKCIIVAISGSRTFVVSDFKTKPLGTETSFSAKFPEAKEFNGVDAVHIAQHIKRSRFITDVKIITVATPAAPAHKTFNAEQSLKETARVGRKHQLYQRLIERLLQKQTFALRDNNRAAYDAARQAESRVYTAILKELS